MLLQLFLPLLMNCTTAVTAATTKWYCSCCQDVSVVTSSDCCSITVKGFRLSITHNVIQQQPHRLMVKTSSTLRTNLLNYIPSAVPCYLTRLIFFMFHFNNDRYLWQSCYSIIHSENNVRLVASYFYTVHYIYSTTYVTLCVCSATPPTNPVLLSLHGGKNVGTYKIALEQITFQ